MPRDAQPAPCCAQQLVSCIMSVGPKYYNNTCLVNNYGELLAVHNALLARLLTTPFRELIVSIAK